ncbi:MAG: GTPase HflX [Deltaproteobacteria bacterium]|nr:GTPase HflX [Deltaproteobacteria bacterium]
MKDIHGNTRGLKPSQQKRLEATYRRKVSPEEIVSPELARHLCELSREIGRQVGVLLDRRGAVESVIVGDAQKIELPDIGRARAGQVRLRGLRLVHTHLKPSVPDRDDLTDLALLRLDLVAVIHAGPDGLPGAFAWAHLLPDNPDGDLWRIEERRSVHEGLDWPAGTQIQDLEDQLASSARRLRTVEGQERAILVGVCSEARHVGQARLDELAELARTAGVEVVDSLLQMRRKVDPKTLIGRGKLEELNLRAMQQMVEVILFDRDLAPSQARAVADVTSVKILDRTQLILDIFAQRAQSNEGKIQVELAQLRYTMPRLAARDDSLSRLTGGIGARGPGETKLEVDRRRVRDRIARLEKQLEAIATSRATRRSRRVSRDVPTVAIVGYTNAGKSTLLRSLTKADVLVEDKLFATLDTASRRLRFPQEREVVMVDTVGFVQDLPRALEAAFRATLEEIDEADLLLQVVDVSDEDYLAKIEAVERVLDDLEAGQQARLLVFNKADRLPREKAEAIARRHEGIAISALKREGLRELLEHAGGILFREAEGERARLALADLP